MEHGGNENEISGEPGDIHAVVAEHGPAHKVVIEHDHAAGKHSVISHHESGHVHKSEHGSAQEAHDHGMIAAGLSSDENTAEKEAEIHPDSMSLEAEHSNAGPLGLG
jgi:hypothetical protein